MKRLFRFLNKYIVIIMVNTTRLYMFNIHTDHRDLMKKQLKQVFKRCFPNRIVIFMMGRNGVNAVDR